MGKNSIKRSGLVAVSVSVLVQSSSTLPRQTPLVNRRAILGTSKHQRRLFSCHPAFRAVRKKHVGDYRLCPESNIATCACTRGCRYHTPPDKGQSTSTSSATEVGRRK
ncbi:hypothetical protein V8C34DRAFT_270485 [Trichoderma compactum]